MGALAGLKQLATRLLGGPSQVRSFDAAGGGRRWDRRQSFGPIGPEVLAAAGPVRSRSRYMGGNNGWAVSGINALVTALAGTGIVPSAAHADPEIRRQRNARLTAWAANADADGLTDFYGIQAAAVRAMIVDGEAFIHLELTPAGLRLRQIPAEMVDESHTLELGDGRRIVAGIEFDAHGRRVAYHVLQGRPTDLYATYAPPVRIPAEDVIHLFQPMGAGQVRGISWLAPVLLNLSENDQLQDALLVAAKISAMHAGFLYDQNGTGTAFEGDQAGNILEAGLEPGTLKVLPSGYDIKFSSPQQVQQAIELSQLGLRAVAAGLGVPEHLLTGDLRGANYSSLRAGLVAFRQRIEQIQYQTVIPQMLNPIWRRVMTVAILSGEIEPDEELGVDWYPPAMPWVDPLKDAEATQAMLAAGLMSRRQAVAALGYDVEVLDAEIAADRERERALGLTFVTVATPAKPKEQTVAD
ncbi:phage portal protein [Methylobacterium bullatum]|uniref:Phage portal protein n=1 Tax=Methylobacterium bullatum TaxID=570505 RepID=A0AAV4ZDR5_9HYPH|nr:phage portal protein [Methylobacterium bullatum]MBD8902911.1 phage portal protein [Methylobacterium bullatum]GJD41948.1 hypothetical protein OICFNHDK_4434 [Methylobacterium bullatum]